MSNAPPILYSLASFICISCPVYCSDGLIFTLHTSIGLLVRPLFFSCHLATPSIQTSPIAHKAKNLSITTSDNEILGAWFVLSDAFYREFSRSFGRPSGPFVEEDIRTSLREYPTVIFFHGNAADRTARASLYSSVSTRLEANVLVIDYRGFGDSTGEPSEAGLLIDARAAWDWLSKRGAKPDSIIIMGHSLGTSVSALLGEQLASEGRRSQLDEFTNLTLPLTGIHPRGVVLMAPFTSVFAAARTFTLFKLIPLLRPLTSLLEAYEAAMWYLQDKLDTQSRLQVRILSRPDAVTLVKNLNS